MAPGMMNEEDAASTSLASDPERSPEQKRKDVASLKQWVSSQPHLPQLEESSLEVFLHSCYHDQDRAKDCIETYYTLRTNTPEFFTNRDVRRPELAKALSALNFTTLPVTDPDGNSIVYHGLREFEPSKYMFVDGIKLLIMTMDTCLHQFGSSNGMIILFNMQGARLTHLTRISLSPIRKFFQYIQDANPVRLKAIHIINVVPFMDKIMAIIKPVMKKELMNLLHFHSASMEEFHKVIPKHCLPSDFGGDLDSVVNLCDKHNNTLAEMADFFAQEGTVRVDESKRVKTSKKNKGSSTKADISFDKLEID